MSKSIHTSDYAALRAELRRARTKAGFSQQELASRLRVPRTWVTKVESGERRLDLIEFCWFMAACGADPLDVLTRIVHQVPKPALARPRRGSPRR